MTFAGYAPSSARRRGRCVREDRGGSLSSVESARPQLLERFAASVGRLPMLLPGVPESFVRRAAHIESTQPASLATSMLGNNAGPGQVSAGRKSASSTSTSSSTVTSPPSALPKMPAAPGQIRRPGAEIRFNPCQRCVGEFRLSQVFPHSGQPPRENCESQRRTEPFGGLVVLFPRRCRCRRPSRRARAPRPAACRPTCDLLQTQAHRLAAPPDPGRHLHQRRLRPRRPPIPSDYSAPVRSQLLLDVSQVAGTFNDKPRVPLPPRLVVCQSLLPSLHLRCATLLGRPLPLLVRHGSLLDAVTARIMPLLTDNLGVQASPRVGPPR